jgi:hypothetical protein
VTLAARQRAERCFALARSTTFPAERDNAVRRGTEIAERAGLSLDLFDIPGRKGKPIPDALFEGNGIFGDNFRYVVVDPWGLDELLARMNETVSRDEAMKRERARRFQYKVDDAVHFLKSRGVRVSAAPGLAGFWSLPDEGTLASSEALLNIARERGFK